MKLEDKFKQSFDHFEPEVDPSVWMKVSAQIPVATPVAPVAGTKGLLSTLGTSGTWIAGIVGTAVVGGLIWMSLNTTSDNTAPVKEQNTQNNSQEIINEVPAGEENKGTGNQVPNQNEPNQTTTISNSKTATNKPAEQPTVDVNSKGLRALTGIENNTESGAKAGSSTNEEGANQKTSSGNTAQQTPAKTSVNTVATPEKKGIATESLGNDDKSSVAVEKKSEKTTPSLILSSHGGFAPLTVTALINQPNQKADFDFGDGFQSVQVNNVSHRFEKAGTYTVRCKIGETELESTVEVLGELNTVFSPNGDGINDIFTIDNEAVSQIDLRIFDRFGKLLYSSKGKEMSWDGKDSGGQLAETGTYFYDIFVVAENGATYKQKGTINLFR